MIVEESRILQVSIFHTLEKNLSTVNFSLLLADVMTIADECDSQLKQTINSFIGAGGASRGIERDAPRSASGRVTPRADSAGMTT